MKWLCACLAVFFMVAPAMAGENPYIAIVGNDKFDAKHFYLSENYRDFLYNQDWLGVPVCDPLAPGPTVKICEEFTAKSAPNEPEICDPYGYRSRGYCPGFRTRGLPNAKTPAGSAGWYNWFIRLPMKPTGEINIVIQCGVLKPNAFARFGFGAVRKCAAETGERVVPGTCTRQEVDPGVNPILETALPRIQARAYKSEPGRLVTWFPLTAYRNPSSYAPFIDTAGDYGPPGMIHNDANSQVLDGSTNARILLKACMDTTIAVKLPVTGQINGIGWTETELDAGDFIWIWMEIPPENTVDIYCHAQSARIMGVGESPF